MISSLLLQSEILFWAALSRPVMRRESYRSWSKQRANESYQTISRVQVYEKRKQKKITLIRLWIFLKIHFYFAGLSVNSFLFIKIIFMLSRKRCDLAANIMRTAVKRPWLRSARGCKKSMGIQFIWPVVTDNVLPNCVNYSSWHTAQKKKINAFNYQQK